LTALVLLEPFTYGFMQRALAEGVAAGVVCGLLGTLVVLRGLTYTGESLGHTLVPGAAVATAVGFSVLLGALAGGIVAALAIASLLRRPDIGEETAVGVVFTGAFAAGVIVLSTHGSPHDLDSILFGSILAVSPVEALAGCLATAAVALLVVALARRFVLVAFDRAFATSAGIRTGIADAVLLTTLAVALTVALRGVGTLLVLGLLVAPAAAARTVTQSVWTMLWAAPLVGAISALAGLELSYYAGVAAGPAICLVALGTFAVAAASASLVRARGARSGGAIVEA
jgi:ABC-type Mn2+/Zn2+ transport system permease subunit